MQTVGRRKSRHWQMLRNNLPAAVGVMRASRSMLTGASARELASAAVARREQLDKFRKRDVYVPPPLLGDGARSKKPRPASGAVQSSTLRQSRSEGTLLLRNDSADRGPREKRSSGPQYGEKFAEAAPPQRPAAAWGSPGAPGSSTDPLADPSSPIRQPATFASGESYASAPEAMQRQTRFQLGESPSMSSLPEVQGPPRRGPRSAPRAMQRRDSNEKIATRTRGLFRRTSRGSSADRLSPQRRPSANPIPWESARVPSLRKSGSAVEFREMGSIGSSGIRRPASLTTDLREVPLPFDVPAMPPPPADSPSSGASSATSPGIAALAMRRSVSGLIQPRKLLLPAEGGQPAAPSVRSPSPFPGARPPGPVGSPAKTPKSAAGMLNPRRADSAGPSYGDRSSEAAPPLPRRASSGGKKPERPPIRPPGDKSAQSRNYQI